jgi:glycerophosphoryl diester phosphodiesterase
MKTKNLLQTIAISLVSLVICLGLFSCEMQDVTNVDRDAARIETKHISDAMAKVRDYVPDMAVVAHRGSVFWVPEETEAAWRWAREMGADYLESDLQCSKDGVILANRDDNLKRTTNIENVFGETVPATRVQFYMDHAGMTKDQAEAQVKADRLSFTPFYTKSYFYEELMMLDAGTWFNEDMPEQAREAFSTQKQYVSTLEDQIKYAEGKMLKRDAEGERVYTLTGTWDPANPHTCLKYTFEYVDDPQDTGNRPGIYLEFKESWLNPSNFEEMVGNELTRLGWNVMTKPEPETNPHFKEGKVNVANTNGKVILQTFSWESLRRSAEIYKGQIPMCFLLWHDKITPTQYADYINIAVDNLAHIIGPSIAGAPNNYFEMNAPWMHDMIRRAGLLNHPYSFDTMEQMHVYFGDWHYGASDFAAPYLDGLFTNRTELTLQYMIDKGLRHPEAAQTVENASACLDRRGY